MYKLTGKTYGFVEQERIADQNSAVIRATLREFIRKRKSGEIKSDMKDGCDIMSLMLADTECFDDDDIIDEVIDLIVAGTQTTQNTT